MAKIGYLEIQIPKFQAENRNWLSFQADFIIPGNPVVQRCIITKRLIIDPDHMDLNQLIKEAKKGSPAAQKCLYDVFSGAMKLVCRRYIKQEQDTEEVMLNGFYKFFVSLGRFQYESDAALFGWIKKIMVNECLMFLRKHSLFVAAEDTTIIDFSLNQEILDRLAAEDIFKLILELPTGYRTVFNLHAVEGWPHKEIAAMLGISEGTSKSQLSKAKKLLQKLLIQQEMVYEQRKTK